MERISLSIVIPCFDEMANLQKGVLDKVIRFLEKKKYRYELIVVDDGSKDGSVEFLEEFVKENPRHVVLIKNQHMGKAGAVTTGVLRAKGDYILFTDMDQATPIEEVEKLLPHFQNGFAIAIGSRKSERKGAPFLRLLISRFSMLLRTLIVGLPDIADTQCGFKMFTKDAAKTVFGKIQTIHHGFKAIGKSSVTFGFDIEILLIAKNIGYTVKEVPVRWLYVETRRVNPITDSIEGILDLIRIRMNKIKGMYK